MLSATGPEDPIAHGRTRKSGFRLRFGALKRRHPLHLPGAGIQQRSEVAMSSDQILHVSDATFEHDVLQSDTPVLVDYWAEWCGPCKLIAPVLDDVAGEYAGRLKVAKVNIDQNTGVPTKYNVRGIPTLMLFKGGAVEATKVGAMSKSQLTAFIDSHL
jgi:thioredoxin 1